MDSAGYLAHLRHDLAAFQECLAGDLAAPVRPCGDWTLYDLADHLGQGNMWAAMAMTEQRGDYQGPAAPRDPPALVGWFSGTAGALLAALDTDPSASAWTIAPPPTAGFWRRRRCLETVVHRWDAEHALGRAGQWTRCWPTTGWPKSSTSWPRARSGSAAGALPRTRSASAPPIPGQPGFSVRASRWPPCGPPRPACSCCCGAGCR